MEEYTFAVKEEPTYKVEEIKENNIIYGQVFEEDSIKVKYSKPQKKSNFFDEFNNYKILCEKCHCCPRIQVFQKSEGDIFINVECPCKLLKTYKIEEYLNLIKEISIDINKFFCGLCKKKESNKFDLINKRWVCDDCREMNNPIVAKDDIQILPKICPEHAQPYIKFCNTDQIPICSKCDINKHLEKNHLITKLKEPFEEIKKKEKMIKEGFKRIVREYEDYINKIISQFNLFSGDELKSLLDKLNSKKNLMVNLISLVYDNTWDHESPQYYQITNLKYFKCIKYEKFKYELFPEKVTKDEIKYFLTYSMLYPGSNEPFDIKKVECMMNFCDHTDVVNTIVLLNDGRLATCSNDNLINIYSLLTYQKQIELKGHKKKAHYMFQLPDDRLISCGVDGMIIIWNIDKKEKLHIISPDKESNNPGFNSLIEISHNRMISAGRDKRLIIWSTEESYEKQEIINDQINKHSEQVVALVFLRAKNIVVSGSWCDKSVRFWDVRVPRHTQWIKTISTPGPVWMNSFLIDGNKLIIGENTSVSILDLDTYEIIKKKDSRLNLVCSIAKLRDGTILLGCTYGVLYIMKEGNIDFANPIIVFKEGDIHYMQPINERVFAICSEMKNKMVKLYKY